MRAARRADMSPARRQLAELVRRKPGDAEDAEALSEWLEEKAAAYDALAEEDPRLAEEAATGADRARAQARRVRSIASGS